MADPASVKAAVNPARSFTSKAGCAFRAGTKIFLDAEVNLQLTSLKPAAAARGEMRWSCRLRDSENVLVEFSRVALPAGMASRT
jgi:hypothetical protein